MLRNILLTFAGLLSCLAGALGQPQANPPRVEAAFLRNFAHYITWPEHAFANDQSPWRICVLGGDPFGDVLDDTLRGRTEQGRPFEVVRTNAPADMSTCQIVFIAYRGSTSRRAALAELKDRPVLTVGDAPEFLQEGGMIRFQVADHVEFGVNLDRTRSASLKIQTRMLEVAHEVVENGVARRRR
ncbi:MAG: YfiR family protein [Rhodocyclales bacterium]|nr:YfiR family protein [Rhodocyclales bacterium]